jgi:type IV pilus assembly protein PilB
MRFDSDATTVEMPRPMRARGPKPMGQLLVEAGVITRDQLDHALREHEGGKGPLGSVLVRLGYAGERAIAQALADQMQMPLLALADETIDEAVACRLPRETAVALRCLPLRREGGRLLLAMVDPLNFDALNTVETLCAAPVEPRIAVESELLAAIGRVYGT